MRGWITAAFVLCVSLTTLAQEPPQPAANDGHGWELISDNVIKQIRAEGKKLPWPGQTTGVTVDHATGDVWMIVTGFGVWRSKDKGTNFERIDGGAISGRCETAYAINADPAGGRFAFFMLDGKGGMTLDGGKTWSQFKDVGRNWDYAAVDWSDKEAKNIFASRHESGGEFYTSNDGGKTWKQTGKDPMYEKTGGLGIFPGPVLVMTKGNGISRSTDGGATWTKVSDLVPTGRVMAQKDGNGWWVSNTGIIVSKDKGQTWEKWGTTVQNAAWGPWFGKDEKTVMVAGKNGFVETKDAGQTWAVAAPLPMVKDFSTGRPGWFLNLAWDANSDTFYAARMGCGTYKFERKK
jgi:photosystem II stability/assembly factor-like uncharacterized protein